MNAKLILGFAALGLLASSVTPTVSALAVSETCTVDVNVWNAYVLCTGLFYEEATLTWCPNHPSIGCLNSDLVYCYVSTSGSPFCILL